MLPACSVVFSFIVVGDIDSFGEIFNEVVKRLLIFPVSIVFAILLGWLDIISDDALLIRAWCIIGYLCIALAYVFRRKNWGYLFVSFAMAIWLVYSIIMVA